MNSLQAWSCKWLLKFNEKKCVVLKIKDCVKYIYTLNGSELQEVEKQRDLGVIINNKLTPADHIHALVSKANQRIHMIRRCFTGLNENKVTTIFKSIIRPGLEYASITWNPWLKKDKRALENIQNRVKRLSNKDLQLESLESRRRRTDLVETYKFVTGKYKTKTSRIFKQPHRTLRGHCLKLFKPPAKTEVLRNFFAHRVIDAWNLLDDSIVVASTTASFARKLRAVA